MPKSIFALAGLPFAVGAARRNSASMFASSTWSPPSPTTRPIRRGPEGFRLHAGRRRHPSADHPLSAAPTTYRSALVSFSIPVTAWSARSRLPLAPSTASFADIHPDDDIFLMTFDGSVRVRQDFTSNRDKLWDALEKVRPSGGTSLYDARNSGNRQNPERQTSEEGHSADQRRRGYRQRTRLQRRAPCRPRIRSSRLCAGDRRRIRSTRAHDGAHTVPRARGSRSTRNSHSDSGVGGPTFPIPIAWARTSTFPATGNPNSNSDTVDMNVLETFADGQRRKAWLITPDTRRNSAAGCAG